MTISKFGNSSKLTIRFRFVVAGIFLLSPLACQWGSTAATPIPDRSFTVTPFPPTRTQFPTPGVTFAPTSTTSQFHEPTPTLEPSLTSTPTWGDVLPVITNSTWRSNRTPTPIATPKLGSENYRLKNWTEADALELIRTLEEYAHKNDIEGGSHSRPNLPNDYKLVELAIREMLFRFPDTRYQETLNWRLALANSLQGETDLDGWVLSRIESYINQDHIKLDDLNAMLMTRGFAVAEEMPASNLFGDGGEAHVYRVQPVDSFGDRGMVFALGKQNQNKAYEVVHIYSDDLDGVIGAGDRIVDIADHNQNGIPEVVFETGASSGSMCYSKVFIFEWRDGQFVDLTQGKISSDCYSWRFSEPDSAGIDTVTAQKFNISLSSKYVWNGIYYELSELTYIGEPGQCSVYIYLLDSWSDIGNFDQGLNVVQSALQNWTDGQTRFLGASCPDYLRIYIGITYALHDQPAKAREIFQSLVASPTNPSDPVASDVAKAFLDNYHDQGSLYKSCVAAQSVIDNRTLTDDDSVPDVYRFGGDLCEWKAIFPMLIESLNQSPSADLMLALQQADVLIQASAQVDIDGDGDLDWLLALVRGKNLWALVNMGGIFQPVYLNNVDIPEDIPDQSAFKVDTFQNEKMGDWFVVLSTAQEFNIYQAEQVSTTVNIANVFNDWYVQQYAFQQTARGLELEIDGLYDYQWNAQQRRFEPIPLFKDDLLTDEYLAYSLPYLERIVSNFGESDDPGLLNGKLRFLYFLGLAYERTGESAKATHIYWQIWHDYPETGYARMACSKIENCVP